MEKRGHKQQTLSTKGNLYPTGPADLLYLFGNGNPPKDSIKANEGERSQLSEQGDKDFLQAQLQPSFEHLSLLRDSYKQSEDMNDKGSIRGEFDAYLAKHQKLIKYLIGILNKTQSNTNNKGRQKLRESTTRIRELRQAAQFSLSYNKANDKDYEAFDQYMIEYREILTDFLGSV